MILRTLLTYSLQKYGVITDNLIPSLEGSGFSGWKVVESSDAGFKPDQLYQASEINNHELPAMLPLKRFGISICIL